MRAYVVIDKKADEKRRNGSWTKKTNGLDFPYITKQWLPVFVLDGEHSFQATNPDEWQEIEAVPGMIGRNVIGDDIYVIDSAKEPRRIPIKIVTEREYERLRHFESSLTKEAV